MCKSIIVVDLQIFKWRGQWPYKDSCAYSECYFPYIACQASNTGLIWNHYASDTSTMTSDPLVCVYSLLSWGVTLVVVMVLTKTCECIENATCTSFGERLGVSKDILYGCYVVPEFECWMVISTWDWTDHDQCGYAMWQFLISKNIFFGFNRMAAYTTRYYTKYDIY